MSQNTSDDVWNYVDVIWASWCLTTGISNVCSTELLISLRTKITPKPPLAALYQDSPADSKFKHCLSHKYTDISSNRIIMTGAWQIMTFLAQDNIDGLAQDCSNSIANALELL